MTHLPPSDLRRHPRVTINVDATVMASGGRPLGARTRDLSRTGICLITAEPISDAEPLHIQLVLAFGPSAFSEPLKVEGRVVWCTPIAGSYQVGVMFEELTEQQEGYLNMFLQFLDGTLAPRGISGTADDTDTAPPSPDDTDDPFKG